jgi:ribonuclease HI
MILTIFTDGGSLNNPGPAASAFLIYKDKEGVYKEGTPIGIASNNVAEYTALINALTKVRDMIAKEELEVPERIQCFADSNLMVSQLNGIYKIKHPDMRKLLFDVRVLEGELRVPVSYTYVPREKNAKADALVKEALGK